MPAMTSAITYGAKKSRRKTARPGKRRLSISAMPSENGIWIASDSTMMIALWVAAFWKIGSDSAFW